MTAIIIKRGSSDYGYVGAVCEDCPSRSGDKFWQSLYPRRIVEGYTLAERDRDEHNRVHHGTAAA